MSEVLGVVAEALEALTQARAYLAHLVQCGETAPACQPEHPERARDRQLLERLDACQVNLVQGQTQLAAQRESQLRQRRANSPLSCPPDLQERIASFETLLTNADSRNVQSLLSLSRQCKEGRLLIGELGPCIQILADIERRGLERAARAYADVLAYPHTRFWRSKWDEYIKRYASDWQRVTDRIRVALQAALDERRELEKRYDQAIERGVETILALPPTTFEARSLVAEVSAIREHEAAAFEAVRRVWRETQGVRCWAFRQAVKLSENDRSLAGNWASAHGGGIYWQGAMESARCAEALQ